MGKAEGLGFMEFTYQGHSLKEGSLLTFRTREDRTSDPTMISLVTGVSIECGVEDSPAKRRCSSLYSPRYSLLSLLKPYK